MFATLYNDNQSIKVLGIGKTYYLSQKEARNAIENCGWQWENFTTVEIDLNHINLINSGVIELTKLNIELSGFEKFELGIK